MQEWTSPVYASQNHLLDVHLCHNDLNRWCINKGLTTNPSISCFHLVISSLSTRNQLSIHRATFLTISRLQMVVLVWRGERGGPETNGNIWTSGSDTPSHLARFHPLRSQSRAQALLRSCKPSSHKPTQPPSDTDEAACGFCHKTLTQYSLRQVFVGVCRKHELFFFYHNFLINVSFCILKTGQTNNASQCID